jgi:hypothetical protein
MSFDVPILFLVFNRPDVTQKVMGVLRELRPARLYVAADGPRAAKEGEQIRCEETRAIATSVDWACEVNTLFREANLGCGKAVSSAITWFFEQVTEGIILEDDCLPSPGFFDFCAYHLEKYRDEKRIASVSGDFFLPPEVQLSQPYYFSKYLQIWGWATWRRTWEHYRFELSDLSFADWQQITRRVHSSEMEARYWDEVLRGMLNHEIDTWDYQLMFRSWCNGMIHIAPTKNLVANIGYGEDGTHTVFDSPLASLPVNEIADFRVDLKMDLTPAVDNLTFYLRFLESLHSIWWLDKSLPTSKRLDYIHSILAEKEQLLQKQARDIEFLNGVARTYQEKIDQLSKLPEWMSALPSVARLFRKFFSKRSASP